MTNDEYLARLKALKSAGNALHVRADYMARHLADGDPCYSQREGLLNTLAEIAELGKGLPT
jgi:hypothetical protein